MPTIPRASVSPEYIQGKHCAICGEDSLTITHLESLPDYVSCTHCEAAFVVEQEGERVLYGKIPDDYPNTQKFALKQWAWLEAIENRASKERPSKEIPVPEPSPPEISETLDASLEEIPPEEIEIEAAEPTAVEEIPDEAERTDELEPSGVPLIPSEDRLEEAPAEAELDSDIPAWLRTPTAPPSVPLETSEPTPPTTEVEGPPSPSTQDEIREPLLEEPKMEEPHPEPPIETRLDQARATESDLPPVSPPFVQEETFEREIGDIEELETLEGLIDDEESTDFDSQLTPTPEPLPAAPTPDKPEAMPTPPIQPKEGVIEPPPGSRARVILRGIQANFPENICVHCMRSPAPQKLVVIAAEERSREGQLVHSLPICNSCNKRARAKTDDEKNARLMAILTSILVALASVVVALALGWVTFEQSLVIDSMILAILAVVGFTIPAWLLLARSTRFPPPPDAQFVRSTLLLQVAEGKVETTFDWRNEIYAKRFVDANYQNLSGDVMLIPDPIAPGMDTKENADDPEPKAQG